MNWKLRYLEITDAAAREAIGIAQRAPQSLYVAVKPAEPGGAWGELRILRQGEPMPEGFSYLTGERLPNHRPFDSWPDFIRALNPPIIGV